MPLNKDLQTMLDCDVTLYVGPHALKGSIGETTCDEVVVLHMQSGMACFRIDQVSGYILHPCDELSPAKKV